MLSRFFIIVFVLTVSCISCVTGIEVVIKNRSQSDKNIRVDYPANLKLPINNISRTNDSLNTYDHTLTANAISTRDYYRYPDKTAIIMLDTINRTYSFNLKPGHDVIIESRWTEHSKPTYGQLFIINNSDTVELIKRGGKFKKSPKLSSGGSWIYTINEQ
jgi:hypothetical protein